MQFFTLLPIAKFTLNSDSSGQPAHLFVSTHTANGHDLLKGTLKANIKSMLVIEMTTQKPHSTTFMPKNAYYEIRLLVVHTELQIAP